MSLLDAFRPIATAVTNVFRETFPFDDPFYRDVTLTTTYIDPVTHIARQVVYPVNPIYFAKPDVADWLKERYGASQVILTDFANGTAFVTRQQETLLFPKSDGTNAYVPAGLLANEFVFNHSNSFSDADRECLDLILKAKNGQ